MAKKKEINRFEVLAEAKKAIQFDVGAGGNIYEGALGSNVRGIRLPSIALMELLGNTCLRDSCIIVVDGETMSSKSSLALDIFNWSMPYGGTGTYIDAENKAPLGLARGFLSDIHLWSSSHRVQFATAKTMGDAQEVCWTAIRQCRKTSEQIDDRDRQFPFLSVIDSVSGAPSDETLAHVREHAGRTDRGHGGMLEAQLWTTWMKCVSCEIIDLPFIVILVNHLKTKVEMTGGHAVQKDHNPGGAAIRFGATIALRCHAAARPKSSQTGSYQDILITCSKNSIGETWKQLKVRKYCRRDQEGNSFFWWDWPRATVEFLAGFGPRHAIRDVLDIEKSGEDGSRVTCKQLGVKLEDISEIGGVIHDNQQLMAKILEVLPYQNYKEFLRLTDDEYAKMLEEARKQKAKALADLAEAAAKEKEGGGS